MTDWQRKFFIESWSRSFWKCENNATVLHFEGNRDVLFVGFDSQHGNIKRKNWRPGGAEVAQNQDISDLGFSSIVPDWYLNPWFDDQVEELVVRGFFDRFSRVVFAGHSMGAHAALRFSPYIKGAYIAAFSPQYTLEKLRAPFDDRYDTAWRLPWRGDETDVSKHVYDPKRTFVFYDPYIAEDGQHAAALRASGAHLLRTYHSDHGSLTYLRRLGVADEILMAICFDNLTDKDFYTLLRFRRTTPWFRKSLKEYYLRKGRPEMIDRMERAMINMKEEFIESRYQRGVEGTP
ncbi:MAG: alpha/beta hydrolase [Paracoccaceae bacterium]|nr:alpha/beta hydrolase [Paracoccaceae bacterium]